MKSFTERWMFAGFLINLAIVIALGRTLMLQNTEVDNMIEFQSEAAQLGSQIVSTRDQVNRMERQLLLFQRGRDKQSLTDLGVSSLRTLATRVSQSSINNGLHKPSAIRSWADSLQRNLDIFFSARNESQDKLLLSVLSHTRSISVSLADMNSHVTMLAADNISELQRRNFWLKLIEFILLVTTACLLFVVYYIMRFYLKGKKISERTLKEQKELLQSVINHSMSPLLVKLKDGPYIFNNTSAEDLFSGAYMTDDQLKTKELQTQFSVIDKKVFETGTSQKFESTVPINGKTRTLLFTKFPVRDMKRNVYAVGTIAADISEQQLDEDLLRTNEAQLKAIFEKGPDAIIVADSEAKIIRWNHNAEKLFGHTAEEAEGANFLDLIIPAQLRDMYTSGVRKFLQEKDETFVNHTLEATAVDKKGREFEAELTISTAPIAEEKVLFIIFVREITTRRSAEKEIIESRNFLNSMVDNIPYMIFVKDADLKFVRINKAGEKLLGIPRENLIGKTDFDFFPEEQAKFFVEKDKEVLREGKSVDIDEEEIKTKDGTRILHTRKIPILDERKNPAYLLGISVDITEQKRAEDERKEMELQLRANELQLKLILENIGEGVIVADLNRRVILSNKTAEDIFDVKRIGSIDWTDFFRIYYPDRKSVFPAQNLPLEMALRGESVDTELVIVHPVNHSVKLLQVSGRPIRGPKNRIIAAVATIKDVTHIKRIERELAESRKSIGFKSTKQREEEIKMQKDLDMNMKFIPPDQE